MQGGKQRLQTGVKRQCRKDSKWADETILNSYLLLTSSKREAGNQEGNWSDFTPLRIVKSDDKLNFGKVLITSKSERLIRMAKIIGKAQIIRPNTHDTEIKFCLDVL